MTPQIDDPIEWIESQFFIPEAGGPIRLIPYQRAVLREAYRRDARGHFVYSVVLWSDIKKSGKSSIAAAVALERARRTAYGSVKIVANDLKQADSRVAFYARRAIDLNPALRDLVKVKPSGYRLEFPNRARIEAIPVDPRGEAGGNDDLIVFSELWAANQKAAQMMWCYDDQTELLTRRGFVPGIDLRSDDVIATVNPKTHVLEWETPRAIYRDRYQGKMHLYETSTSSQCVTPNHRLYGIFSYNDKDNPYAVRGIMRSDELRQSGYGVFYPLTSVGGYVSDEHPDAIEFPATKFKAGYSIAWNDWCEYVGWYLAEGRVKCNGGRPASVYTAQSYDPHPHKWEALRVLHERIFSANGFRLADKGTSFVVDSAELAKVLSPLGNTQTKFVPENIKNASPESLRIFFDAFIQGDGHITKHGTIQVSCGSRRLTDDLCEIGLKLGYVVSARPRLYSYFKNVVWRITFMPRKDGYERIHERRKGAWKELDYDGIVWCPSTQNGLLVVRRKGTISVSGNTEMTLSPTKFGMSQRWVETYAGYAGESPLLEQLYEQGVREGYPLDLGIPGLEVFANEQARLLCLWNTVPRCPWQTDEYYAQERAMLVPGEFDRVHRNAWASSQDRFVPVEWWDSCEDAAACAAVQEPVVIGMDAATSNDCFAVVVVSRRQGVVYVKECRAWSPPPGGKIEFAEVERYLYDLKSRYIIREIAYDPYQLHDMAQRLYGRVGFFKAFAQGQDRLIADKQLYDLIRDGLLRQTGDPTLAEHIGNANAKVEGERLRIVKRSEKMKIDAAVALSMAANRAIYYRIGGEKS